MDRGCEDIAEISRLSRALLAAYIDGTPGPHPLHEDQLQTLCDEVANLPAPGRVLQMLAAMAVSAHSQVVRLATEQDVAPPGWDSIRRDLLAGPGDIGLLTDCLDIVDTMRMSPEIRDRATLHRQLSAADETWGTYAVLALLRIVARLVSTWALFSRGSSPHELIRRWAIEDEQDLVTSGEDQAEG